ncbi:hypothetical protein [Mesorhizobium sp. L-8-3]|uniref:hypothetical protein n=1 Tax=Mesorhizobium sp. L-8-3 TaxID=2744522 RepID=UPI0019379F9D|nr:hypothetical protein [Mesorhizobium sp. L-8-3]BCH20311.1 hypothetical protein MesoLjLb_00960 [Mesorhizobium sp. L-8-3]
MPREADQMRRAGNYVLGLMDDIERARAERDLEIDADFRGAVLRVAERMRLLDLRPDTASADAWRAISARIAEMPQMRGRPSLLSAHRRAPGRMGAAFIRFPALVDGSSP